MNTISEKIIRNAEQAKISIKHGRKDEWNEFVEFDAGLTSRLRYAVQNSKGEFGDCWFVFRVERGKKGAVKTLFQSRDFGEAVEFGYMACNLSME